MQAGRLASPRLMMLRRRGPLPDHPRRCCCCRRYDKQRKKTVDEAAEATAAASIDNAGHSIIA